MFTKTFKPQYTLLNKTIVMKNRRRNLYPTFDKPFIKWILSMTFIVKMHLIYTILLNEINWEKKMNVISDLAYHTCMNNNLLLVQLFKQTLTQFFFLIPLL